MGMMTSFGLSSGTTEQFIISKRKVPSAPPDLGEVLAFIKTIPHATVVSVAGSPEHPERLVVQMSAESAAALSARFGPALIVEADRMLLGPDVPFGLS
jgi:hypothetical protein